MTLWLTVDRFSATHIILRTGISVESVHLPSSTLIRVQRAARALLKALHDECRRQRKTASQRQKQRTITIPCFQIPISGIGRATHVSLSLKSVGGNRQSYRVILLPSGFHRNSGRLLLWMSGLRLCVQMRKTKIISMSF